MLRSAVRAFAYVFTFVGAIVAAITLVAWKISLWHRSLVDLLVQAWSSLLASLSCTGLSLILFVFTIPLLTFIVTLLYLHRSHPERGIMERLRESAVPTFIGFAVPLAVLSIVFAWNVVTTVYADHTSLVGRISELQKKEMTLVDRKSRDDEIGRLKDENDGLQTKIRDLENRPSKTIIKRVPEVAQPTSEAGNKCSANYTGYVSDVKNWKWTTIISISCNYRVKDPTVEIEFDSNIVKQNISPGGDPRESMIRIGGSDKPARTVNERLMVTVEANQIFFVSAQAEAKDVVAKPLRLSVQ